MTRQAEPADTLPIVILASSIVGHGRGGRNRYELATLPHTCQDLVQPCTQ